MIETARLDVVDGIGTITLTRPEKLNALNLQLAKDLRAIISRAAEDERIQAVIVTGSGRAFSVGGDVSVIREMQRTNDWPSASALLEAGKAVVLALRSSPKPTIAAINGPAAGAGLSLALACDMRVAAETATLGLAFSRLGLHPDWGGTYFLPRLVGSAKAMELIYSGGMIAASEALRVGLVGHVVPPGELADVCQELALGLAHQSPLAFRLAREAIDMSLNSPLEVMLDHEITSQMRCFDSPEGREGVRAFLGKRPPRFRDAKRET